MDLDEFDAKMRIFKNNPRCHVVVETVRKGPSFIYNAEVGFCDKHYVVRRNCSTRAEAEAVAQEWVDKVLVEWDRIRHDLLKRFPLAKE